MPIQTQSYQLFSRNLTIKHTFFVYITCPHSNSMYTDRGNKNTIRNLTWLTWNIYHEEDVLFHIEDIKKQSTERKNYYTKLVMQS